MITSRPDPDLLRACLSPSTMWRPIDVVVSTGSTNADLAAAARDGAPPGQVLIASEQTAGRGRLARQWTSPADASVSMSVLLAPTQPVERWGWLSLLAGLAVSTALTELAPDGTAVALKWPNDVLVSGGKVCGILSERVELDAGARAVVGIGLNLTLGPDELPVPTATSLRIAGFDTTATDVVAGVLRHLERYHRMWEAEGGLQEQYRRRCSSIGAELTISTPGAPPIPGIGHDIDELGRIQVRTRHGLETFAAGDVVHAAMAWDTGRHGIQ